MDWKKYSYVVRAKNRRRVLLALDTPRTPTQISNELGINISHVSRALRELESKELVRCLTPDEKVGRVYKPTKEGEEISEKLRKSIE